MDLRKYLRLIPGLVLMFALTGVITAGGAVAGVQHGSRAAVVAPDGAPKGCESGFYCSYNKAGGANLCLATNVNESDWGNCQTGVRAIFNNGADTWVEFFPLPEYIGSWYCLEKGHYLLDLTKNKFNEGGPTYPDYDQPMAGMIDSSHLESKCTD